MGLTSSVQSLTTGNSTAAGWLCGSNRISGRGDVESADRGVAQLERHRIDDTGGLVDNLGLDAQAFRDMAAGIHGGNDEHHDRGQCDRLP